MQSNSFISFRDLHSIHQHLGKKNNNKLLDTKFHLDFKDHGQKCVQLEKKRKSEQRRMPEFRGNRQVQRVFPMHANVGATVGPPQMNAKKGTARPS